MYEEFFQLSGKPFQLSPDARFFFNSSGHNRALAYLKYGIRQGEGFIVITGGIGTGKSMLVAQLFEELDPQNLVAAQLVSTQVEDEELLRMVCIAFNLQHEGLNKASMLRNLEAFFRARRTEGRRVLLVVDEAQNLPPRSIEELRMLSNYQHEGQALLQSFLIGQAELRSTLQAEGMEQVRQRIIAGYHLRPLDRQEMQSYIEHRLQMVGWKGNPLIEEEAFDRLYQATGGVPRRINTTADRLLLYGALEELDVIDHAHVETVVSEIAEETGQSMPETLNGEDLELSAPETDDLMSRLARIEADLASLKQHARDEKTLLRGLRELVAQLDEGSD